MDATQPPLYCSNPACQEPIWLGEPMHVRWASDDDGALVSPMLPFHPGCAPAMEASERE